MIFDRFKAGRIANLAYAVVYLATASCADPTAAARSDNERARKLRVLEPTAISANYSLVAEVQLDGVTSQYNPAKSVTGPTLPNEDILYRLTATGTVTSARSVYWSTDPAKAWPAPDDYGPYGFQAGWYRYIQIMVSSANGIWYATTASSADSVAQGHAIMRGQTSIARNGSILTGSMDCSNSTYGYGPCNTYTDNGQAVTFEKVLPGFNVEASPTTLNYGDTVTITANPTPWSVGGINVPWSVVDTTIWAPVSGSGGKPCDGWWHFLPHFAYGPKTCRRPALKSGTLTVQARVNGTPMSGSVAIVVKPKLTLTCTPSTLVRTNPTSCVARVIGATGPLQVTDWEFSPSEQDLPTLGRLENPTDSVWSGQVVVSGTVTVSGVADGQTLDPASVTITVQPRNWSAVFPAFDVREVTSTLRTDPRSWQDLGNTAFAMRPDTGLSTLLSLGPNNGLYYVDSMYTQGFDIQINHAAFASTSAFVLAHPHTIEGNTCHRAFVESLAIDVGAHEGLNFETDSHTRRFRDSVLGSAIGPAVEGIVVLGSPITVTTIASRTSVLQNVFITAADQADPISFSCQLKWEY